MTALMKPTCTPKLIKKPEITSEIDAPFPPNAYPSKAEKDAPAEDTPFLMELRDQKHNHEVEDLKNAVGKKLLYGCLIAIVIFAIIDAYCHIESPMFTSAFEVAKIVATTVLGYLFGSKTKS